MRAEVVEDQLIQVERLVELRVLERQVAVTEIPMAMVILVLPTQVAVAEV
jgi:hypothetical protein